MKLLLVFWVGCAIVLSGGSHAMDVTDPSLESKGVLTACDYIRQKHDETVLELNRVQSQMTDYSNKYGSDSDLVFAIDAVVESWELRVYAVQLTFNYFECGELYEYENSLGDIYGESN